MGREGRRSRDGVVLEGWVDPPSGIEGIGWCQRGGRTSITIPTKLKTSSSKGGPGVHPQIFLASAVANDAFQCHLGSYSNTPTLQKIFLFGFTLISRMILGVGKSLKLDLSLKILIPEFEHTMIHVCEWSTFKGSPPC